jgi:hypothetical protein
MICNQCGLKQSEKGSRKCNSCNYKQKKKSNPIRIAYTSLKGHAKERGKDFDLTIEQFEEFCIKSNYLNCRGIEKFSYHIDRKDETKGYEVGNLQLLTNIQNVRKYIKFVEINRYGTKIFKTQVAVNLKEISTGAPF